MPKVITGPCLESYSPTSVNSNLEKGGYNRRAKNSFPPQLCGEGNRDAYVSTNEEVLSPALEHAGKSPPAVKSTRLIVPHNLE